MNILEALKEVENGNVIRGKIPTEVFYILQTTLSPFGEREVVRIEVSDFYKQRPEEIKDLSRESFENISMSAVVSNNYRVSSLEEMLNEIQREWDLDEDD